MKHEQRPGTFFLSKDSEVNAHGQLPETALNLLKRVSSFKTFFILPNNTVLLLYRKFCITNPLRTI